MTLPLSRSTTYIDDSLPAIAAQDLNDLQDYQSFLYNGVRSVKGIVLDASGNVVYSRSADSPLLLARDSAGNNRSYFDHLGYLRGRYRELNIDWLELGSAGGITGAVTNTAGRLSWNLPANGTANDGILTAAPGAACLIYGNVLSIANATSSRIYTAPFFQPATYTSLVLEFDIAYVNYSNLDFKIGLVTAPSATTGVPTSGENAFAFGRQAGDTHWQLITSNGSTAAKTDTGVTPNTSPVFNRVTMELHGSGSPYGSRQRLFIDEVPIIDTSLASAPVAGSSMGFAVASTTTSASNQLLLYVSPVRVRWNAYLSAPLI